MMTSKSKHPFDSAPLGTPALEVCAACGQETGSVLLKTRGRIGGQDYSGPHHVAMESSRCEFCRFLEIWCASEKHDPKTMGKVGAAKIVEGSGASERLVAFVPFTEHEDLNKTLADGTPFTFQHGMVIRASRDGDDSTRFSLVEIVKPGV
jgi:hypothetical protein